MNIVTIKFQECKDCPKYINEEEDVDVYHGGAYTYFPPRCNLTKKELKKSNPLIPDWCPLLKENKQ